MFGERIGPRYVGSYFRIRSKSYWYTLTFIRPFQTYSRPFWLEKNGVRDTNELLKSSMKGYKSVRKR